MVALSWISSTALALALMPAVVLGIFCGESSVPFSFEARPNGEPVLGCAKPACFGWTLTSTSDAPSLHTQTVKCASTSNLGNCPGDNQWIGGVEPAFNISSPPVITCCESDALRFAEKRGVAVVAPGQIVVGGEVFHDGRPYAIDYISDVIRHNEQNGTVFYDVFIRRLPCLPNPGAPTVAVDGSTFESVNQLLPPKNDNTSQKAFAAPTEDTSLAQQQGLETPVQEGALSALHPDETLLPNNLPSSQSGSVQHGVSQYVPPAQTGYAGPPPPVSYAGPPAYAAPPAQAAPAPYYPVAASGGGGGCCSYFCFAKDSIVSLPSGTTKRMDELEVDDWVLSAGDNRIGYSRVRTWLHRMESTKAEFIRIHTEDGNIIKLTAQHYIYRGQCQNLGKPVTVKFATSDAVFAEEIEADNCLFVHDSLKKAFVERRIVKIDRVVEEGIYAPLTENGNVIVNNVLASCYNVVENESLREGYPLLLNWFVESFWGRMWSGSANDISLIPGVDTLVHMVKLIVPGK